MAKILDKINSPDDVKKLHLDEMKTLAEEIRQELIQALSKTGGHLGPNLGVVELTIALHHVFDSPKDKILMDVSHQAYVHKILTGRRNRIDTIRQYQGLNGFMLRTESAHDSFGAGHAGTAVSAALGMATARDIKGTDEHVIAVAGDAAFTCGVTFEGLNNISQCTKKMIVVLNDNEWSISKNVGAIAHYLNKIVTSEQYSHIHKEAEKFIERIGGKGVLGFAKRAEEAVKGMILPEARSVFFEDLGLRYYGPIDGHDVDLLVKTFKFLKDQDEPVILHIQTIKGKGYEPALAKPDKFHGLGAYTLETGETTGMPTPTFSELLGHQLAKFALKDKRVIGITGAMSTGTGLIHFQKKVPAQFYDVGIAEEHAVLFGAGMATMGLKPVCAIYSTFLQRAYDMIHHDVALQNLNVFFCMDRAGLSGDDGPTHHGLFDIAYMRCLPNMTIMAPKDEDEFVDMLYTGLQYNDGPIAMRYPRGIGTGVTPKDKPKVLEIGKAEVIHPFKAGEKDHKVAIISYGMILGMAQEAATLLEKQGYSVAVINARFAKPFDNQILEQFAREADALLTFEDHALMGGFGSIVIEQLQEMKIEKPVARVGWPDEFVEHGKPEILREKYGLTAKNGVQKVLGFFVDSVEPSAVTVKTPAAV
ncbi:MAG: 1-deoxy-D-xylulose-5-phosphate synthase [Verrucomicrobiota bacterium]|nr:1-deoxy-D-xylulose-5-phosphate synthase [Verrucomicrobiota bacterium]